MDVDTRVEMDAVQAELRAASTRIPNALRDALREAAELEALPRVRAGAPSFTRMIWVARASRTRAYITTRGKRELDRAAGLLNYGGTVRTPIVPRRVSRARAREVAGKDPVKRASGARALTVGSGGVIRAAVNRPRRYSGKHYLERDVAASVPGTARRFRDKALGVFEGLHTERSG